MWPKGGREKKVKKEGCLSDEGRRKGRRRFAKGRKEEFQSVYK
jgi:hypothetical protein